jgi:hypothetical protein
MPLTYSWVQISGPNVTISNPASATLNLNAAEVAADTAAQFRVTVTAGADSAAATVNVTFANIAQTPVFRTLSIAATTSFSGRVESLAGHTVLGLAGTTSSAGGPVSFQQITLPPAQLQFATSPAFSAPFSQPAKLDFIPFAQAPVWIADPTLNPVVTVMEETANRLRIFQRAAGGVFSPLVFDRTIEKPCYIHHPLRDPTNALGNTAYVGQRSHGFSVIRTDLTTGSLYQEINTGQSFCALVVAGTTVNDVLTPGGVAQLSPVIAVDTAANTVSVFTGSTGDPNVYALKEQAPVQLNAGTVLSFVAATQLRGFFGDVSGLALIYTDGQHSGQHRLVVVGLNASSNLVQETRSWPIGVPADVLQHNLDQDLFPEIVVISSTSPQAIVFEATGINSTLLPLSATPSYLEIGLGATSAVGALAGVGDLHVAYRDRGEVRLFRNP